MPNPNQSLSIKLSLKLGLIKARFTFADGYTTHSRKRKPTEAMLAAHGRLVGTVFVDQPVCVFSSPVSDKYQKSDACRMVLRLMDEGLQYSEAMKASLEMFPNVSYGNLETELDFFI